MSDLKKPMTREDFILLMPIILEEVVAACTSPDLAKLTPGQRLTEIANRIFDAGAALPSEDRGFVIALAKQLMATEPDD